MQYKIDNILSGTNYNAFIVFICDTNLFVHERILPNRATTNEEVIFHEKLCSRLYAGFLDRSKHDFVSETFICVLFYEIMLSRNSS